MCVDENTDETGTKVICEKSIGCFIHSHKYYHGRRWSRAIWSNGAAENPQLFNHGPWSCVWRDVLSPSQTFRRARRRSGTSVISSCNLEITVIARDQRNQNDGFCKNIGFDFSLIDLFVINSSHFCVVSKNLTSTTVTRDFLTL